MAENTKHEKEINKESCEIIHSISDVQTSFNKALFMNWRKEYDDIVFLGCYTNKIDDEIVALYHNSAIHLIGRSYTTVMYTPKILFHYVSDNHIHIDDFLMKNNNIGNGSIAMDALIRYVKLNRIEKITGDLSSVDDDHRTRRDHFYQKFGFVVSETKIILNISDFAKG